MRWMPVVMVVAACETTPPPACPEGVPLTDDDLPCDCQGTTVDSLSCGTLTCDAGGLTVGTTTTTGCTTSDTGR